MKKTNKRPKPTGKAANPMTEEERSRNFIEKARELGCDETGVAFEKFFDKTVPRKQPMTPVKNDRNSKA